MITIPLQSDKKWTQTNSGDVFGNLYATKNINFDREGYLTLSKKTRSLYKEASSGADFDQVLAIVFSDIGDMVVTSDEPFDMNIEINDTAPLTVNNDSGVQSATSNGDALAWNGRIYQTGSTATKYWDGSTWTSASIVLTSGVPHPMCVFESLNYLAVATDNNIVKLYDTSHTLVQTLTIPEENEIQWMVYKDSNLYIGTASLVGRNGRLYVWNGAGTSAQKAWDARGESLMSGCEYANSIATISSIGQLLLFNGGGFTELANLPVYYTDFKWTDTAKRVARRGMIADGELLYISLEGQVVSNGTTIYLPTQPSGLWCYDPKVGLYHRGALSPDMVTYATISSVDTSTDTITISSSIETQTGETVFYASSGSTIGGLLDLKTYYAIRSSGTQFKIAETYDDAINGTAINLTSSGGGKLVMPRGGDFGNTFNSSYSAGAVALIPESRAYFDFTTSRILFGGWRVAGDTVSSTSATLQAFTLGENRGSFITQKIYSDNIEDVWNRIVLRARNVINSNDMVILKYRTVEKQFYPIIPFSHQLVAYSVVWTSTSSFTVTDTKWANVVVGEEVEIIAGSAAGYTAHITAISESSGTYTVTIDETLSLVSAQAPGDTSQVVVNNWTKGAILAYTNTVQYKSTPVQTNSKWIQIKCELRGEGTQIEDIQVVNKTHLPTV